MLITVTDTTFDPEHLRRYGISVEDGAYHREGFLRDAEGISEPSRRLETFEGVAGILSGGSSQRGMAQLVLHADEDPVQDVEYTLINRGEGTHYMACESASWLIARAQMFPNNTHAARPFFRIASYDATTDRALLTPETMTPELAEDILLFDRDEQQDLTFFEEP